MSTPIYNPVSSGSSSGDYVELPYLKANFPTYSYLTALVSGLPNNDYIDTKTTDTAITSKLLTNFNPTAGTITASDTILSAIGKNTANQTALASTAVSLTGTQTLTNKTITDLKASGKTVIINSGGATASAGSAGVFFEEAGNSTNSYVRVSADRAKIEVKAPTGSLITLNQSLSTTDTVAFPTINTTNIGVNGLLNMGVGAVRKKIALYNLDNPTSTSDHQFNGFGIGASQLIYQVNQASNDHVFYSATSGTTSNELLRIAGTGGVSCAGAMSAGITTLRGGFPQLNLYPLANNTEASMRFHTTIAGGRNWVVGQGAISSGNNNFGIGTGDGAGNFLLALRIIPDGSISCAGTLTAPGGLIAPAINASAGTLTLADTTATVNIAGGTIAQTVNIGMGTGATTINIGNAGDTVNIAGVASNYAESTFTTTFIGPLSTASYTMKIVKVGSLITLHMPNTVSGTTANINFPVWYSNAQMEASVRPLTPMNVLVNGLVNGAMTVMNVLIETNGSLYITRASDNTAYYTGGIGFNSFSASWIR